MAGGQDQARNIGRDPRYGLRQTRKQYRLEGAEPVGPRLFRWRGLLRRRRSLPADGYDASSPRLRCAVCGEFVCDDDDVCPECREPLDGQKRVRGWWAGQSRRSQVARARLALFAVGIVLILWAGMRMATSGPGLAPLAVLLVGSLGVVNVALVWLAGSRPVVALAVGTIGFVALTPFAVLWLLTYGPQIAAAWAVQSVVAAVGTAVMIGILVTLASGWRAALKLVAGPEPDSAV